MFVLGNVVLGLGQALLWLFRIYGYLLIARAVISWVSADPHHGVVRFIVLATEPPLRAVRRMLPVSLRYYPIDVAFIVLVLLVIFGQYALAASLIEAGARMTAPGVVIP